jgi:hypothetical protein
MVQAVSTLGTTTYQVNALRQWIRKTNSITGCSSLPKGLLQ